MLQQSFTSHDEIVADAKARVAGALTSRRERLSRLPRHLAEKFGRRVFSMDYGTLSAVARETGYSIDEVDHLGIDFCRTHPCLPEIRPAVPRAPVSTLPASPPVGPGACAHDVGSGVLPASDWPFDDPDYARDDPPRWVWFLILGTLFALLFTILGYSLATLVQAVRVV